MTFSVNTRALAGLPTFLDRRADDLSAAAEYVGDNTTIQTFSLMDMFRVHQRVVDAIDGYLLATRLAYPQNDAVRIRAAIASYEGSDLRASRRADAAITGLPRDLAIAPPLTPDAYSYGPAVFDDHAIPSSALITPSNHYDDFPYQPSWSDLLSPSSIVRDVIWQTTSLATDIGMLDRPIDPVLDILPPFIGDWAGLLRCADVFDYLGAMLGICQDCVDDAGQVVSTVWTGKVASMCVTNLRFFATDLGDATAPLSGISATYRQVSQGVRDNAMLAAALVTTLSDTAVDGALEMATHGIFAAFDVAAQIRDFVQMVKKLVEIANVVADTVSAGSSLTASYANRLGILHSVGSLPTLFKAGLQTSGQIPVPVPVGR